MSKSMTEETCSYRSIRKVTSSSEMK